LGCGLVKACRCPFPIRQPHTPAIVEESWELQSQDGDSIQLQIQYVRGTMTTSKAETVMYSAAKHVTADAAVSVMVIISLVAGRQFGWVWLDPLMGFLATAVILSWAWTLVRSAGAVLLDVCPDPTLSRKIAARLEQRDDRVSDLHLWRVGPGHLAAIISLVTDDPQAPGHYKKRLSGMPGDCSTSQSKWNAARAFILSPARSASGPKRTSKNYPLLG
jgi:Cation efflux family